MTMSPNYPPPPPPPPTWGAPQPPAPPVPTQRNWFLRHKILTGISAVIAVTAVAGALGEGPDGSAKAPTAKQAALVPSAAAVVAATTAPPPATEPSEPAEPTFHEPTKKDFKLTIKTLETQCFGSAGCNVTFRVKLEYTPVAPLDPDKTYELTYSLRGGEDPLTNTLTVTGDKYERDSEEFVSTRSSSSKLSVVVVDVEEAD